MKTELIRLKLLDIAKLMNGNEFEIASARKSESESDEKNKWESELCTCT